MKRIGIFSLAYYPKNVSGAEIAIKEITDRISPDEYEFHLITLLFGPDSQREEKIGNVFVHRVGFGGAYLSKILFIPLAALKARAIHKTHHLDALWAMMTYMLFPTVLARFVGVRIPYMLTLQDGDPYEKVFERWFIRPVVPILNYGFRHARYIQAISNYLATWPKKRGYKGEVVLIPNGASLPLKEGYDENELAKLRSGLGIKVGDKVLITVARLVHQKAQDVVVRALADLPHDIVYLLVGEGEDRSMLEKLGEELGVRHRMYFTGQVDRTMTAKYRKISDIFVLPSRSEGQGISFLSTMVSGLPIIATQEGGIADFLFDAKRNPDKPTTGWAVDVDSPAEIVDAVGDILRNPERVKRITQTAHDLAHTTYNWDNIALEIKEKIFANICSS